MRTHIFCCEKRESYVWWLTGKIKYALTFRYVSEYTTSNAQGGHQAHNTDTRLKQGLGFQNGPGWCHDEDTNPNQHKTHYHTTQHSHQTTRHSHLLTMTGFTGIPIKTFNTLETLTIIAVNEWPKTKIMFLGESKNNFLTKFSRTISCCRHASSFVVIKKLSQILGFNLA